MRIRLIIMAGLVFLAILSAVHAQGTTFTVTTTADTDDGLCDADCSLREAINAANNQAGTDTIAFNVPGAGVHTIQPITPLPPIMDTVVLDAKTQPGYSGLPLIELDGSLLTSGFDGHGLVVATTGSIVCGLAVNYFPGNGIVISDGNSNTIESSHIGIDSTGTEARGNGTDMFASEGYGIAVYSDANTIGGSTNAVRNVISANRMGGVLLLGSGNQIGRNYIGTNADGVVALGSQMIGVYAIGDNNLIGGGSTSEFRNTISGNAVGVNLTGSNNILRANYIGPERYGLYAIGNTIIGIDVSGNNNYIGGDPSMLHGSNTIYFNGEENGPGIGISGGTGNVIGRNSMKSNGGLGIDLGNPGVTANDAGDVDSGPNNLQNYPILTFAESQGNFFGVIGVLDSEPNKTYEIEVYSNTICDVSGHGEGERSVLLLNVTTDENGQGSFRGFFRSLHSGAAYITAMAREMSSGQSSEFSPCQAISQPTSSVYTVNTTDFSPIDFCWSDYCSLHAAINAANAHPGPDTIQFNIPGTGVKTIHPTEMLHPILDSVVIDGTTQPGYAGTPIIELNGSLNGNIYEQHGLFIESGQNVTIRGLVINKFPQDGIYIENATNVVIEGNYIGTDPTGTIAMGNGRISGAGIRVYGTGHRIGGTEPGMGNLISGNNAAGIILEGTNHIIQGNLIGTNAAGNLGLGNQLNGINVFRPENQIGGTATGAGNVISGNTNAGIWVLESNNVVQGNWIGTDRTASLNVKNGWMGIDIMGDANLIGGTEPGAGNVIAFNGSGTQPGIFVSDLAALNSILGNRIFQNAGMGIDLAPIGLNTNDPGDSDTGANNGQNSATISSSQLTGDQLQIAFNLNSTPQETFRVEFFANTGCPPPSQADRFLGFAQVTADANGDVNTSVTFTVSPDRYQSGDHLTATVTSSTNDTSEVIGCQPTVQTGPVFTVNTTSDTSDGVCDTFHCSFREAMNAANNDPDLSTIAFNIPGTGVRTIKFTRPPGRIGYPTIIDGWTQPGFQGTPLIEFDGSQALSGDALELWDSGSTVRGLIIHSFYGKAIYLKGVVGGHVIEGNYIGTDATGTEIRRRATGSSNGIVIESNNNRIGGTTPMQRNLISGSRGTGIAIAGANNLIQGNYIGTDVTGMNPLGNNWGIAGFGVNHTITDNRIAFNTLDGVQINYGYGFDFGMAVYRNSIFSNGGLGVDINAAGIGVLPNDPGDADTGPNGLQNFPVMTVASTLPGNLRVVGGLNSTPNQTFRLDFYSNQTCDPSGYGEGETYLGTTNVTTDAVGNSSFVLELPVDVPVGFFLTALATDASNSTSEFSPCQLVAAAPIESPQLNYYTTAAPTLAWVAVPNAAAYGVEVDNDADFSSPTYTATGITDLFVTTDPLPDGTYYWRVRMVNANGQVGMWSLVDTFVVDAP
ncbi:MAG: CSLREA domain-containing protein [Anaerolineae bacterium]|nr:CSLREA domain-containing protein [Anaerolineae bacterium]